MGEIYREASIVLVWLGKQDARSAIAQLEDFNHNHDLYIRDLSCSKFERIAQILNLTLLCAFFDTEWSRRLWIVQELVLAQDVRFFAGSDSICYSHLSNAMDVFQRIDSFPRWETGRALKDYGVEQKIWNHLTTLVVPFLYLVLTRGRQRRTLDTSPSTMHIADLGLDYFHQSKCMLEHDRIYAFLSMAGKDLSITPDYEKPIEAVWRDLAIQLICNGSLHVLRYARLPSRDCGRTCSYAPDRARLEPWEPFLAYSDRDRSQDNFKAGLYVHSQLRIQDDMLMNMHGILLDFVADVDCLNWKEGLDAWELRDVYNHCSRMSSTRPMPYRESFTSVFARSTVADNVMDTTWLNSHDVPTDKLSTCLVSFLLHQPSGDKVFVPHHKVAESCGFSGWTISRTDAGGNEIQYCYQCSSQEEQTSKRNGASDGELVEFVELHEPFKTIMVNNYPRLARNTLSGRSFFVTSRGYFGFGIADMQPGDMVVIPHGLQTPYILRPVNEDARKRYKDAGLNINPDYQIVGECYLHGWMFGDYFGHKVETEEPEESSNKGNARTGGNEKYHVDAKDDKIKSPKTKVFEIDPADYGRHKVERNREIDPQRTLKSTSFLIY
jgi:hypothetical protein